jgi:hypothetical protein
MRNNNIKKNTNTIFVLLISLFIIVFVIVAYFMLTDGSTSYNDNKNDNNNYNNNNNNNNNNDSSSYNTSGKEVFNVRDNIFTYNEARAVCAAHEAELASLEQIVDSYKKGANWCSYGWSEGQLALYPTQKDFWNKLQKNPYKKYECGKPGVNGGFFENKEYRFGANCYGVKPKPKPNEIETNKLGSTKLSPTELKADEYRSQLNRFRISPFNNNSKTWHSS